MKYKLLAIDMDGTFLNEGRKMTEYNLAAVRKAAEAGVKVVICSGRMHSGLKPYLEHMPEKQPLIAVNGSIVYDHNKKELCCEAIENEMVEKVIDVLRRDFENIYYHFFDKDIAVSERFEKTIENYYTRTLNGPRENKMEIRIVPDSKKYIKDNNARVLKIEIVEDSPELRKEIRSRIEQLSGVEIVSQGPSGLEITKKGSNKGNALEFLAKHYGYSLEECIAVGNDENDVEMIKKAGLGIAVSNAKDYVKKVADYITTRDNNNDAILEVVDKFIQPVGNKG